MNRRPLSFRPRFVDIDRAEARAERELAAHDARFAIDAYDRDPRPPRPLPQSAWERFDRACSRITWLHVTIASAAATGVVVVAILISALERAP